VTPYYVVIFGTRPEATKLHRLCSLLNCRVWFTGQHEGLLRETCDTPALQRFFTDCWRLHLDPLPDPLNYAERVKWRVARTLRSLPDKPTGVIVQGDTSSAYGAALGAQQAGIPIAHVEAGIRSGNLQDPWPEERFRVAIDGMAYWHFAPTEHCKENLLAEGAPADQIFVTGNTGLDDMPGPQKAGHHVLITLHRRETFPRLKALANQLDDLAREYPDITFLWPVHPNPHVQEAVKDLRHVQLRPPLGNRLFRDLLSRARFVITDSGGVQEEAADLGVPCLVARETTDRPESVLQGIARVIGTNGIEPHIAAELDRPTLPRKPSDCFGDGQASTRIADILNNA